MNPSEKIKIKIKIKPSSSSCAREKNPPATLCPHECSFGATQQGTNDVEGELMSNLYGVHQGVPHRSDIYPQSECSLREHTDCGLIEKTNITDDAIYRLEINHKFHKKTQKRKKNSLSKEEKSKLWEMFELDKEEITNVYENKNDSMVINKRESMLVNKTEISGQDDKYKSINSSSGVNTVDRASCKMGINKDDSKKTFALKDNLLDDICKYCNSILIISDDGFPTCCNSKCGIICKDTLDYSPEWRYYGAEDKNQKDPTRCGNPINPLLVESSFSCKVLLSGSSSYEMRKICKWTEWQSMPHKEKSLYDEFQFITIMAQNAGIPKIFIDDAIAIHKDISEQKMFRGMNRDGIKAASIYISCRLNGCPRTAHEIAEIFILDKASATSGCSMAVKILHNIERKYESSDQTDLCTTRPIAFIDRYCSKLNMNGELTMLSKFVANKVEKQNIINNNTPHSIAAGVVFFIAQNCNLNISKQDMKLVCGVSEVTINKCYKKLENIKDKLIPNCILEKYSC